MSLATLIIHAPNGDVHVPEGGVVRYVARPGQPLKPDAFVTEVGQRVLESFLAWLDTQGIQDDIAILAAIVPLEGGGFAYEVHVALATRPYGEKMPQGWIAGGPVGKA